MLHYITLQSETLHMYVFILDNWNFTELNANKVKKNLVLYISSNYLYFTVYEAHVIVQHQKSPRELSSEFSHSSHVVVLVVVSKIKV